jgi:hypothetical protein
MTISKAILGQPSKHYDYDEDVVDRLFFNNIDTPYISSYNQILTEDNKRVNNQIFYKLNSLNYRSDEFYNSPDIIFSGCSFTYGIGLKKESLWTDLLAKKMNKKYINLGLPGKSVSSIINNLYSYFREYGHPEYVFCLFPNFNRFELPINPNIIVSERNLSYDQYNSSPIFEGQKLDAGGYLQDIIMYDTDLSSKPQYSKKPHVAENVLSIDLSYWTAIKHILAFEQYCKVAGVKLLWTTCDKDLNLAIDFIKNKYPNQYNNFILLDEGYDKDCHSKEKKDNIILWDLAGDRDRGNDYAHPGVHFHIHVADAFYSALAIDEIE